MDPTSTTSRRIRHRRRTTVRPQRPRRRQRARGGAGGLAAEPAGFRSRGRARRRARFLRKARELAYRDLGGLVFNLHRFGQRNDALVLAKLTTLGQIDTELRALEGALGERQPITVLREAGITACPRCAAIHSSEDSFCPNCGLSMRRHADLPIAGAATLPTPASAPQPAPATPGVQPRTARAARRCAAHPNSDSCRRSACARRRHANRRALPRAARRLHASRRGARRGCDGRADD